MKNFSKKVKEGTTCRIFQKSQKQVGNTLPAWEGAKGHYVIKAVEAARNGFSWFTCIYTAKK